MHRPLSLPARAWVLAIAAVLLCAGLPALVPPPAAAATGRLIVPFAVGQSWYVCQGYNGSPSHSGDPAFDLTTDPSRGPNGCYGDANHAANKPVYAPGPGTLAQVSSEYGGVCITLTGGGSIYLGHLKNRRANGAVKAGDQIGIVAPAGEVNNGGYAHVHMSARNGTGCGGTKVPFTSANNMRFQGVADLTSSGASNQWSGTLFKRVGTLTATPTPTISGSTVQNQVLTAKPGTWQPQPVTLAYQWRRAGAAISGATASTYKLTAADVGKRISVAVTGSKSGYTSVTKTSAESAAVTGVFSNSASPAISGLPRVGETVTATTGSWSPAPTSYAYQWFADGTVITGATGAQFTPQPPHRAQRLTVRVTAKRSGYQDGSLTSAASEPVADGEQKLVGAPVISGVAQVDQVLTTTVGEWEVEPDSRAIQWYADDVPIDGAIGTELTVLPELVGATLTSAVVARREGYSDYTSRSEPVGPVVPGRLDVIGRSELKGPMRVGRTVRVIPPKTVPAAAEVRVRWVVGDRVVRGEDGARVVVRKSWAGKRLVAIVTLFRDGYEPRESATRPSKKLRR